MFSNQNKPLQEKTPVENQAKYLVNLFTVNGTINLEVGEKNLNALNSYQILGLSPTATMQEIKSRYRSLSKFFHSDTTKFDTEIAKIIFQRVKEAGTIQPVTPETIYTQEMVEEYILSGKSTLITDAEFHAIDYDTQNMIIQFLTRCNCDESTCDPNDKSHLRSSIDSSIIKSKVEKYILSGKSTLITATEFHAIDYDTQNMVIQFLTSCKCDESTCDPNDKFNIRSSIERSIIKSKIENHMTGITAIMNDLQILPQQKYELLSKINQEVQSFVNDAKSKGLTADVDALIFYLSACLPHLQQLVQQPAGAASSPLQDTNQEILFNKRSELMGLKLIYNKIEGKLTPIEFIAFKKLNGEEQKILAILLGQEILGAPLSLESKEMTRILIDIAKGRLEIIQNFIASELKKYFNHIADLLNAQHLTAHKKLEQLRGIALLVQSFIANHIGNGVDQDLQQLGNYLNDRMNLLAQITQHITTMMKIVNSTKINEQEKLNALINFKSTVESLLSHQIGQGMDKDLNFLRIFLDRNIGIIQARNEVQGYFVHIRQLFDQDTLIPYHKLEQLNVLVPSVQQFITSKKGLSTDVDQDLQRLNSYLSERIKVHTQLTQYINSIFQIMNSTSSTQEKWQSLMTLKSAVDSWVPNQMGHGADKDLVFLKSLLNEKSEQIRIQAQDQDKINAFYTRMTEIAALLTPTQSQKLKALQHLQAEIAQFAQNNPTGMTQQDLETLNTQLLALIAKITPLADQESGMEIIYSAYTPISLGVFNALTPKEQVELATIIGEQHSNRTIDPSVAEINQNFITSYIALAEQRLALAPQQQPSSVQHQPSIPICSPYPRGPVSLSSAPTPFTETPREPAQPDCVNAAIPPQEEKRRAIVEQLTAYKRQIDADLAHEKEYDFFSFGVSKKLKQAAVRKILEHLKTNFSIENLGLTLKDKEAVEDGKLRDIVSQIPGYDEAIRKATEDSTKNTNRPQ